MSVFQTFVPQYILRHGSHLFYATLHYAIWVVHSARRIRLGSIFYEWTGIPTVALPCEHMLLVHRRIVRIEPH